MATFRKQENCPTSQELLSYQLGDLEPAESRTIGKHLSACEFCSAEVAFYERYPNSEEPDDPGDVVKMPEPLFELAEAILNHKRGSQSMADIMKDIDSKSSERR